MNSIRISKTIQNGNRIDYDYEVKGEWEKYFCMEIPFFAQYSQNIESVPQSIAVLPLIGNVIVMAALFDAVIYVDEIDQDFYDCVGEFIEGYQKLSPQLHFKKSGLIEAQRVISNTSRNTGEKNMLFFSGGADAWSSLLTHLQEKPVLVSIWGADLSFENEDGWKNAYGACRKVAEQYDLESIAIQSSLRRFTYNEVLDRFSFDAVNDNWWSAFHHSVGMMCLAAPVATAAVKNLYFASTYSAKDKKSWGSYVTASDPLIDNHVRFGGCQIVHDGYEFSRHDKIQRICSYFKDKPQKPYLRVCFSSAEGANCGRCEKCANTIMSILLSGEDPAAFGLPYQKEQFPFDFAAGLQEMAREEKYAFLSFYYDIWAAYRKQYSIDQVPDVLKTFYCTDIEMLADFLNVPCNKCKANKDLKVHLENISIGKNWLEQQWKAWMRKAEELESICSQKDEQLQRLQMKVTPIKGQANRLKRVARKLKTVFLKKHDAAS